MQKGHQLQFQCPSCRGDVIFSIFSLDEGDPSIICSQCKRNYTINDKDLRRQLQKFEALCMQIIDSEEILSHTSVGIDIGEHHVKIPFKLLLTRLNSSLDLDIGGEKITINFRLEPTQDIKRTQ